MADDRMPPRDPDVPPRGYNTTDVPTITPRRAPRPWGWWVLLVALLVLVIGFALWAAGVLA